MRLKFMITTLVSMIITTACLITAQASGAVILSPEENSTITSSGVLLSARTDLNYDCLIFQLDGEMIAEFSEVAADKIYEYTVDSVSYGEHSFSVHAITAGEQVMSAMHDFTVRDSAMKTVKTIDFNSDTSPSQNVGFNGNSRGELQFDTGNDGTQCLRLQGTVANAAENSYLSFFNTSISAITTKMVWEFDLLLSDSSMNLRIGKPSGGKILRNGMFSGDAVAVEDNTWYHMRIEWDYINGTVEKYANDMLVDSASISDVTSGTECRLAFASSTGTGYALFDNWTISKTEMSPLIKEVWAKVDENDEQVFGGLINSDATQIKLVLEGTVGDTVPSLTYVSNCQTTEIPAESITYNSTDKTITISDWNTIFTGDTGWIFGECSGFNEKIGYQLKVVADGFCIRNVKFMNSDNTYEIKFWEQLTQNEDILAKVTINNPDEEDRAMLVITAVYSDGIMKDIAWISTTVTANSEQAIEVPLLSVSSGNDEIICYVCDSWAKRIPFTTAGTLLNK